MGIAHTNSTIAVSTSAVDLAAVNHTRKVLLIINMSDTNTVYIRCGGDTPTGATDSMPLGPGVGIDWSGPLCDTSLIQAIAPSGDCNVYVEVA